MVGERDMNEDMKQLMTFIGHVGKRPGMYVGEMENTRTTICYLDGLLNGAMLNRESFGRFRDLLEAKFGIGEFSGLRQIDAVLKEANPTFSDHEIIRALCDEVTVLLENVTDEGTAKNRP